MPGCLLDQLPEPAPAEIVEKTFPGPVDHERLPPDFRYVDKSPEAAVEAAIAVVSHDKNIAGRYGFRAEVVALPGW